MRRMNRFAAHFMIIALCATLVFPSCDKKPEPEPNPVTVNIAAIQSVTNPVTGAMPVTTVIQTEQYIGTIAWTPAVSEAFAAGTEYTATITLTAKDGFTFIGVAENFFTVEGAETVSNAANSGVITVKFPVTEPEPEPEPDAVTVTIADIQGVTNPVTGAAPVTTATETEQFTGTVLWTPAVSEIFAAGTEYTATITLTAKDGFTFIGVTENFFIVEGAVTVSNDANSGVITVKFPATEPEPDAVTVNIAAIQGLTQPVTGATPVTTATETEQYTGAVTWTPVVSETFATGTEYTATITLTAKDGFTFIGVAENFFTVEGAVTVSNAANSGVVTSKFPATEIKSGTAGNLTWKITSDGTLIISGTGDMPDYESNFNNHITAPWDEYRSSFTAVVIEDGVTSIGDYAFAFYDGLMSATIGNSVRSIGNNAFSYCSGLTSVTIGNSVNSIRMQAFWDCKSLTKVTIPNTVTFIGDYVFSFCSGLTEVIIGNSVTSIGWGTFYGCSGLTEISIPNSVTSIGMNAFENCKGLKSIIIGNSVKTIGNYAFVGCSGLTSVTFGNSLESIGDAAFYGCNSLSGLTIPNSVTSIGGAAFYGCSSLTSVTISSSVEFIGYYPFSNCSRLISINVDAANSAYCSDNGVLFDKAKTTLIQYPAGITGAYTIPNSVESVGNAFVGCHGLSEVTIPNSVTEIGSIAFSDCSGLITVNFNAVNCGAMGNTGKWGFLSSAFSGCNKLITVNIGSEVTRIPAYAFITCSGLTSVTIPSSVTSIGELAFSHCSGLTSVIIPNSVKSIEKMAFFSCTGLKSVAISSSITSIGDRVFADCSALTELAIPNSVTSIGESAFAGCSGLTSVIIPNSVTSIGSYAFSYCTGLMSVIIPNSVTSIGSYAFRDCSGLMEIINQRATPQAIDTYVFYNVDKTACTLRLPAASIEAYRKADDWKDFVNIVAIE